MRNDRSPDVAVNIPVNSTVGPSGAFYLLPSILPNPANIGCWASTSCTNVWRYCDHSGCLVCVCNNITRSLQRARGHAARLSQCGMTTAIGPRKEKAPILLYSPQATAVSLGLAPACRSIESPTSHQACTPGQSWHSQAILHCAHSPCSGICSGCMLGQAGDAMPVPCRHGAGDVQEPAEPLPLPHRERVLRRRGVVCSGAAGSRQKLQKGLGVFQAVDNCVQWHTGLPDFTGCLRRSWHLRSFSWRI